jgi:hypothetical protein
MTEKEVKSNRAWREECEALRQQLAELKETNGRLRQEKVNARHYFELQLAECQALLKGEK